MPSGTLTDSLRETLAHFDVGGPPRTTTEVADDLDLGRRSTYNRLDGLADRGHLETKKVGAGGRVWWRPSSQTDCGPADAATVTGSADSLGEDVFDHVAAGVFVLDENARVAWVNETAERYFGLDHERVLGRDNRRLVEEDIAPVVADSASFTEAALSTDDDPDSERFVCRVTAGAERESRWLERRSQHFESGEYEGGRVELYYDVSEQRHAEQTHQQDRRQFESLVDAVEEYAIFVLDAEGYIQTWNAGAATIKGYESEEIIGEHVSTFYTDEDRSAGVPSDNLDRAATTGSVEDEGWRIRKDGTRFWASVTITAIEDDNGDLQGYVKVTRDMTEWRERERERRRERELVTQFLDTAPIRLAIFRPDGTVDRLNSRTREALGLDDPADAGLTVDEVDLSETPGETMIPAYKAARTVLETGDPVTDQVVKHDHPDGSQRWVSLNARPLFEDGIIERVVVTGKDVTERKRNEQALERQREELAHELDEVLDRIDDAFFAVDDDWRFTHVNDRAAAVLGRSQGALIGQVVWDEFPEAVGTTFQERYEHAMDTGEQVTFEEYYPPLDTWFEVTAYPSETGLSVYFRDVSGRKERERELERYETIIEAIDDGVYVVDEDGYFTEVNETYATMVGEPRDSLVGSHVSDVIDDADILSEANRLESELQSGDRSTASLEATLTNDEGETRIGEATFSLIPADDDYERVGVVRDVTDRRERERELERYETIVETVEDGIYLLDENHEFRLVNSAFASMTGYDREDLLGTHATRVFGSQSDSLANEKQADTTGGEASVTVLEEDLDPADGDSFTVESRFTPFEFADGVVGRIGTVRDITTRLERERELKRRVRQQESVTALGQRALEDRDVGGLVREAVETVARTLDVDYCKVLDLDEAGEKLYLRDGVGWDDGVVGTATLSAVDDASQAAYTLRAGEPVVVTDLGAEERFTGPDLLTSHDVRSGISVCIGPEDDPWGVLGTHDTEPREFTSHDVRFVQSVANILASAIVRREDERELRRQREQLAALNNLHEVAQKITAAVIEQSTRDQIEETVCEFLADTESYMFAWVGDVDATDQTVRLRTEAGVEGYLDGVTISVDPADPRSDGPTGRAFRTGDIQITRDVDADERHDPWRDHVRAYGFRSSAAIPIVHEDTVYGVLNVYAERPDAFDVWERTVLAQLGEVVGHAIAATERKQALLSDDVVELEFHIPALFDDVDVEADGTGPITIEHVVPIDDEEFLVYGRVAPADAETVRTLVGTLDHWTDVQFRDGEEESNFELQLSEPPLLSELATHGGAIEEAIIEDGDYHLTLHVPPTVDVRRITETVRSAYPAATLLKRNQKRRTDSRPARVERVLTSDLTDRQRTALEAAYHAGFFDWPRDAAAEEVAASLDIAPSTFHYHLRNAERKVVGSLVS